MGGCFCDLGCDCVGVLILGLGKGGWRRIWVSVKFELILFNFDFVFCFG